MGSLIGAQGLTGSAAVQWRFFFGASFRTGALLLPHARATPVVAGIALACALQWGWSQMGRR
jgi:hypothetical protein